MPLHSAGKVLSQLDTRTIIGTSRVINSEKLANREAIRLALKKDGYSLNQAVILNTIIMFILTNPVHFFVPDLYHILINLYRFLSHLWHKKIPSNHRLTATQRDTRRLRFNLII